MIERLAGSILLTNGYGSRRPKNIQILIRIQIRNAAKLPSKKFTNYLIF
jgi:hypothetical protein